MKRTIKSFTSAAVVGLFAIGTAYAASIPWAGELTYIGNLDPAPPPGTVNVEYNDDTITTLGAFTRSFFFFLDEDAQITVSASLVGDSGDTVTGYQGQLYFFTPDAVPVNPGDVITGTVGGSVLGPCLDLNPIAFLGNIGCGPSATQTGGQYFAWIITGNYVSSTTNDPAISHSGQLDASTPPAPEPATLALLGVGLLGFAAKRLRSKA